MQVIEGQTTLVLLVDKKEQFKPLNEGQIIVIPQGIWHRFESPDGVKLMTITPQPTDHSYEHPTD